MRGILRHFAYTLDNIAFAYNIGRWSRLLNQTRDPLEWSITVRRVIMGVVGIFVTVGALFLGVECSNHLTVPWQIAFYFTQGALFKPFLFFGYVIVFLRFRLFAKRLLERNSLDSN